MLDVDTADPFLANLAYELQGTKPMLHPDILAGAANDREREVLKGFLTGLAGVQKMDAKAVCLEAILLKIATTASAPALGELLTLTKYCKKHLPTASVQDHELWIIDKQNGIRRASEVLFATEFKPSPDWEKHKQYVPGTDFLASDYVSGCTMPHEFRTWRDFMSAAGVKGDPDNGVEVFAMTYAKQKLAIRFQNIVPVDKLNHGYDLEAEDASGAKLHI